MVSRLVPPEAKGIAVSRPKHLFINLPSYPAQMSVSQIWNGQISDGQRTDIAIRFPAQRMRRRADSPTSADLCHRVIPGTPTLEPTNGVGITRDVILNN